MTYEVLKCELQSEVAIITLNRPEKRNALSRQLRDEIVSCLADLEQDEKVKAIVITGSGDSFCAGFDLAEFQSGDMQEIFSHATNYHYKVYNASKPTVAAVNGSAMAGGMDLAAMCDVRVVTANATFGQPQVKMGIAAAFDLLRTVVPEALARELCLTGRKMDAQEAKGCGFVNRMVESENLIADTVQLASEIAQSAGSALMKSQFKSSQPDLFE
jgi:enoyl-CoA hydratase